MSVIHLKKEEFDKEVLECNVPVLVDFWAEWCGPCQMVAPVVDEIAEENPDIKVCKVNVDDQQELARQYHVMGIPTFMVFKDGKMVKRDAIIKIADEYKKIIPRKLYEALLKYEVIINADRNYVV